MVDVPASHVSFRGSVLRSPWLLTTYKSWHDPPSISLKCSYGAPMGPYKWR